MNNTINLSTGLKTYNLVFSDRDNDTVQISFNPKDVGMLERIKNSENVIIDTVKSAPENLEEGSETAKLLRKALSDQLDYIFGYPISDKVFKHCHPLTPDDSGKYFIEKFFDAVTPVIKRDIAAANKASRARISKHTSKYKK